jgi:hypothetical protein
MPVKIQPGHIVSGNLYRASLQHPIVLPLKPNTFWITYLCKALPWQVPVKSPLPQAGFYHVAMMSLFWPFTRLILRRPQIRPRWCLIASASPVAGSCASHRGNRGEVLALGLLELYF